jgi:hypothetical protein
MAMAKDQDVLRVARHLIETRGGKAGLRAAQRAAALEAEGDDAAARLWRSIERAIGCIESGRCGRPN